MDVADFKKVLLPLQSHLYAVAYRILGNADDARDAVQDLYVRLWEGRDTTDFSSVNVKAYTTTMLRNACYDRFRRQRLVIDPSPPEEHPSLAANSDVASDAELRELSELARKFIAQLPDKQREVIELRDIGGLEMDEIASATGQSEGNIRVLLSRARHKIKEQLEQIIKYERKRQ